MKQKKEEHLQGTRNNIHANHEAINREKPINNSHTLPAGSIQASRGRQANPSRLPRRLTGTPPPQGKQPADTQPADIAEYRDDERAASSPLTDTENEQTSDKQHRAARRHGTDKRSGRSGKQANRKPHRITARNRPRPAARPDRRQARRGERMTPPEGQRKQAGRSKQAGTDTARRPTGHSKQKKRRGEVLFPHPRLPLLFKGERF